MPKLQEILQEPGRVLSNHMSNITSYGDVNPNFRLLAFLIYNQLMESIPRTNYVGNLTGMAITTACKYPVEAARWCDWVYSEEGHMYKVFGIEGETYEWVDGFPKFTDLIVNNPDGLSFSQHIHFILWWLISSRSTPI